LNTKELLDLAGDPRFIEGIYNYCDRWCERCPLTSRCLLYAQERADGEDLDAYDINSEAFVEKLKSIFEQTREMITAMAKERGIDLDSLDLEDDSISRRRKELRESHPLARAAERYAKLAKLWFDQEYPAIEQELHTSEKDGLPLVDLNLQEKVERVGDALEVVRWYQFQIAVKIMRGLMRDEFDEEDASESVPQKDSDGSVKVALIGMDRSMGAWGRLKEEFPSRADTILPFLVHLERLRRKTEQEFPDARKFIRPGFDEAPDQYVS
jgi:hypothetical protein